MDCGGSTLKDPPATAGKPSKSPRVGHPACFFGSECGFDVAVTADQRDKTEEKIRGKMEWG